MSLRSILLAARFPLKWQRKQTLPVSCLFAGNVIKFSAPGFSTHGPRLALIGQVEDVLWRQCYWKVRGYSGIYTCLIKNRAKISKLNQHRPSSIIFCDYQGHMVYFRFKDVIRWIRGTWLTTVVFVVAVHTLSDPVTRLTPRKTTVILRTVEFVTRQLWNVTTHAHTSYVSMRKHASGYKTAGRISDVDVIETATL